MKLTQDIHKAAAEALANQPVTIPRAQYDALMKAKRQFEAWAEYPCPATIEELRKAVEALSGILEEGEKG